MVIHLIALLASAPPADGLKIDLVPLIVGLIGVGGLGAFVREIVAGLSKILGGMSARESNRKIDIVAQRDQALVREARAWQLVDGEAEKRRQLQEYAARLRRQLIESGLEPEGAPVLSTTITRQQLDELRNPKE